MMHHTDPLLSGTDQTALQRSDIAPPTPAALLVATKWRTLTFLALAELLSMAVWFSASAVIPALTLAWELNDTGRAWLTMSVQIGFVLGAFFSAVLNLPDRMSSRGLFASSALLSALTTALIPLLEVHFLTACLLRTLTGFFLAGVYPIGMKIVATWTREDRGLGIGLLVGALTLGSASPHLLNVFGGVGKWQIVLYLAAGLALLGAFISLLFVHVGPYRARTAPFNWRYIGHAFRNRGVRLANFGYLGHMWELYAMWAWMPLFIRESFEQSGIRSLLAYLAAFATVGVGSLGCLLAGLMADKLGRTTLTIAAMGISGICALIAGFLFGSNPLLLTVVCLLWGFAVVADSAQFSAAISELAEPEYVGTALTLQTSLGFLLTMATIRLVPYLTSRFGWHVSFAALAIGPVLGIWAMASLRRSPEARKLAGGLG